ncbi:hypothetical protein ACFSJY_14620 [Thalassotalea euphylliae]|uniref:hypothetical protein n=1 Tax=Thalassotalea euphylliae TaxID=1655234 RepID=UPI00363D11E5
MRFISILLVFLLQACSSTKQTDEVAEVESPTCNLAYTKYQATVTGYCQEERANLIEDLPIEEKELEMRSTEDIPEFFWYNEKLRYSLIKQENKAPMAFVIAGTGASHDTAKMVNLQQVLFEQGYHVISLASPTFSNHIINATTRSDMIGDLEKDAKTLYRIMKIVDKLAKQEDGVDVDGYVLTGYSLGGAHSAFISHLDETEKAFNFEKVVMVNPPVSLYNSVSILDGYLDLKTKREQSYQMFERIIDKFAEGYAESETSKFNTDTIYAMFGEADLTEEELQLLIGVAFRMSLSDMLYAIDLTYDLGALTYKNHEVSKFESVTHSMDRAAAITFQDYFEKAMVPWSQEDDPSVTRESLIHKLSLRNIEDYLKGSEKISVVTNADDIILAEGEVEYLQSLFGNRAKIFERGGHCGNMDRVSFVNYMKTQFAGAQL